MIARSALTLILLTGCSNDCQLMCSTMADVARDECDLNVSESQVTSCVSAFEDSSDEHEDACETYANVKDEAGWTCEILDRYFD